MLAVVGCSALLIAGAAAASTSALDSLLLRAGDAPGFTPHGPIHRITRARTWAMSFPKSIRRAALTEAHAVGLRAIIYQLQTGSGGAQGTSAVDEVSSPANARKLLRFEVRRDIAANAPAKITRYTVRGITGSLGFTATVADHGGASNAQWVQGDCVLEVGDFRPASGALTAPVVKGAQAIHRRTHDSC